MKKYATKIRYLWFDVTMHYTLGMDEVDCRHKFSCDATCFSLSELVLATNTIKQLSSSQQLHYNVYMKLINNTFSTAINSNHLCVVFS